jgi:hypothetical protein
MALEYVHAYSMIQQRRRLFAMPAEIPVGPSAGHTADNQPGIDPSQDKSTLIS